jgi:hypothetical protein
VSAAPGGVIREADQERPCFGIRTLAVIPADVLARVLRGEKNPAHLLTPHNTTSGKYADREDVVLRTWD